MGLNDSQPSRRPSGFEILPVNVFSVFGREDGHNAPGIVNLINDPVGSDGNAPRIFRARQLLCGWWTRI
jgi:hypothetical protein